MVRRGVPLEQLVTEMPELIGEYRKLRQSVDAYAIDTTVPKMRDVACTWIHGPTRVGKSWLAIQRLGLDPKGELRGIYFKSSMNKWWDGYKGEDAVLIDELPYEANKWIVSFLKKWGDKLPCLLEYKGGTRYALFTKLVVTCQHSIQEFFTTINFETVIPQKDIDAIKERFTEIHIPTKIYI